MLLKCAQKIQILKSKIHISIVKDLNKIRNSSNFTSKSIRQESKFLTKKPKREIFLISLTFIPPLIPAVYAKETKAETFLDIQESQSNGDKDEESVETVEDEKSFTWKEFWNLIAPNYVYFIASILGSFAIAYLNIKIPICLGELTNEITKFVNTEFNQDEFLSSIKRPAINLIWSYLLQGAFSSLTITALSNLGENIAVDLKNRLFQSIINQDIEFFDRRRSGEISSVFDEIQNFKSGFKLFFAQGLRSFTQTIGCAISLFIISPKMATFLCVFVPNIVLVGFLIGRLLRDVSIKCQEQSAKCSGIVSEIISSIRTIKSCAMEEREADVYANEIDKLSNLNKKLGLGIGIFQGLTNVALNGIVLSSMLVGGYLMSNNEITPGEVMSFLVASQTIQRSLASLSLMTGHYIKYINSGNRIFEFINSQPQITSIGNLRLDPLIGEVSFRKVSFSYPLRKEHKVFDNFNLRINPGQTLAIVGPSGSGKSTLAMLLERFYDVDRGSVNIDGVNLKSLDLKSLRSQHIGYINQDPSLFATSIIENIRYGFPTASDEEVYKAAKLANAHDFIEAFPDSYQTIVGERGVTLSGGQKQRICIAREILKNPKILILDEATSALDSESEKLITEAIEKLMKGRTVLIIAHRLSTVRNADQIAVISNGKIREIGNHDELVRLQGLYYQLIKQQQSN